jgi:hypothetical protein
MYVAGLFADAGWNVYFPRRDQGFDYIVTREAHSAVLVRPVQVKGLYPTAEKCDRPAFGYKGNLSLLHPEMVLVLVFFTPGATEGTPQHIAYMPCGQIRVRSRGGYRCVPAVLKAGMVTPRRDFAGYFDRPGLAALSRPDWA